MRLVLSIALLAGALLPAIAAAEPTESDKAAALRVSSYLQQSGQLRNYRIGVTYENGVATLVGTVASAEQRDTAIRLAQEAPGVSRVVCQLQCGHGPAAGQGPRKMTDALGGTTLASAQGGPSHVSQAYAETGYGMAPAAPRGPQAYGHPAPAERAPLLARTTQPTQARRPAARSNMPLPAPRPGMPGPIRQVSAQGMYPPAGPCRDGSCGPMMGPEMCGSMGPEGYCPPGAETGPAPMGFVPHAHARGPSYENAQMPAYAWPSYAAYPNYAAVTYPKQYSPTAWPYIGPFYPYPQVPLAWRKVSLEWDDGWWFLDFSAHNSSH